MAIKKVLLVDANGAALEKLMDKESLTSKKLPF